MRWLSMVTLLGLCACSGGGSTTSGEANKGGGGAAANGPILIGEYGSLTGSEATFGQSTHNGVLLAIDEINAAGGVKGRKLEVKVYDDQGKAQEAGTAVTRLITEDKVVAVLGEVASTLSQAGGRVAQQYKVPMISPSSTNIKVTQIGDMVSRVCFIDDFQGYVVAKFAKDDLKVTKAAILYDQKSAYSVGLKDVFTKEMEKLGGTIVSVQAYTAGDQDFSAQLTTIRGAAPEAIFIPGYYTDVGNIAIQARNLGLTATLLGGDGWDSAKLGEIGGAAIEGAYYSNHYAAEETRPEVQKFVTDYKARYGQVPDGLAALGYDATKILADAIGRSPSLDGPALAKAIASTKDFAGVTGRITIDPARNAEKPAVIVKMQGGKPVFVTSIAPSGSAAASPAGALPAGASPAGAPPAGAPPAGAPPAGAPPAGAPPAGGAAPPAPPPGEPAKAPAGGAH